MRAIGHVDKLQLPLVLQKRGLDQFELYYN